MLGRGRQHHVTSAPAAPCTQDTRCSGARLCETGRTQRSLVPRPEAMSNHPTIAITSGEPAGIGPELIAMLAQRHQQRHFEARLIVLGDRNLLIERAQRIGLAARYAEYDPA